MILTEGQSDRNALVNFFTELYSRIDEDIEVFFPRLHDEYVNKDNTIAYDGDITSRNKINEKNILPMLLKMFIQPCLKKHDAYKSPASILEVIHLVDLDGIYLADGYIKEPEKFDQKDYPFYDKDNKNMLVKNRDEILRRNIHKKQNLQRLIDTKKLEIRIDKGDNAVRLKNIEYIISRII